MEENVLSPTINITLNGEIHINISASFLFSCRDNLFKKYLWNEELHG